MNISVRNILNTVPLPTEEIQRRDIKTDVRSKTTTDREGGKTITIEMRTHSNEHVDTNL